MQNKLDKDFFKLCFNLPPEEAIKFLEKKGLKVSIDWFDVYREEHVRAFTVAGITKLDVLKDVRDALVEAQKNGETLESFKQNIIPKLRQKGWYGNRLVTRKDGSEKEVKISSPWRLKTIYRTNMAVAAMTGLYKELKAASDIMPYWRYVTVGDGRVREEHAKIHGKILRHDDPFWDKYFPPNGYNCRCSVEGITEIEFKKKGYKLSEGKSMANLVMPFVKTGWDYNPGKEYYTLKQKDCPEEFKPIAEKITKEAEKALVKIEKPEDYFEAKTIEEAERYAVEEIGVKRASFKGLALDIVNEFNYAIKKAIDKFPIIKKFFNFIGEISERDGLLKKLIYDKVYNGAIDSGLKPSFADAFAKDILSKTVAKTNKRTILQATSKIPDKSLEQQFKDVWGISLNKDYPAMVSLKILENSLKKQVEAKFHPVGTASLKASIDHEIGHILDELLNISGKEEIRNLFYLKDKSSLTEELSEYSWNNSNPEKIREFIAESWSEYRNNPKPRTIAMKVGKFIENEYNKKYGKQ